MQALSICRQVEQSGSQVTAKRSPETEGLQRARHERKAEWVFMFLQVGDASMTAPDKEKQVERMGLTPDWIIQVTAFKVFQLSAPTPEQPYIRGLLDPCTNSMLAPNIPAEKLYDKVVSHPFSRLHVIIYVITEYYLTSPEQQKSDHLHEVKLADNVCIDRMSLQSLVNRFTSCIASQYEDVVQ